MHSSRRHDLPPQRAPRSAARRGAALLVAALTAVAAAGLAACSTLESPVRPTGTSTSAVSIAPTSETRTIGAGAITFAIDAPARATIHTTRTGGVTSVRITGLHPAQTVRFTLKQPAGAHLTVEGDRSVEVTDGSRVSGGLAPFSTDTKPSDAGIAAPEASGKRRLTVQTDGNALLTSLGTGELRSATWGTHDGGRSLAVDPNTWAREAGQAGADATWSALIREQPAANTPGMHDQLTCHSIGATTKPTWNLEPWRPDLGLIATIAARCNP